SAARTVVDVSNFKERRKTTMAKVPNMIRAALDFSKAVPEQILAQGYTVLNSLTGNPYYTHLPVELPVFKTGLDAYSVSTGEARDGRKKASGLRNRLGEDVIRVLRALAHHVELNCKDDMHTFLSSGFQPRSNVRTPAQPLGQPVIVYVDQGNTGQLLIS